MLLKHFLKTRHSFTAPAPRTAARPRSRQLPPATSSPRQEPVYVRGSLSSLGALGGGSTVGANAPAGQNFFRLLNAGKAYSPSNLEHSLSTDDRSTGLCGRGTDRVAVRG